MKLNEKFDRVPSGLLAGLIFPFLVGIIIFVFSSGHQSLHSYLLRIKESDIVTHAITLCVVPNIIIFLIFNRFDMLRAARGVLAMTIVWAAVVFGVKFLG
jgi:hypothetical protein